MMREAFPREAEWHQALLRALYEYMAEAAERYYTRLLAGEDDPALRREMRARVAHAVIEESAR